MLLTCIFRREFATDCGTILYINRGKLRARCVNTIGTARAVLQHTNTNNLLPMGCRCCCCSRHNASKSTRPDDDDSVAVLSCAPADASATARDTRCDRVCLSMCVCVRACVPVRVHVYTYTCGARMDAPCVRTRVQGAKYARTHSHTHNARAPAVCRRECV